MDLQELEKQIAKKLEVFFMMQTLHIMAGKGKLEIMEEASAESAKEIIELFNELDDSTVIGLKSVH